MTAPRPYDYDTTASRPAAEYRQMWETLGTLGYTDQSFYVRVMRACDDLTVARRTSEPRRERKAHL